MRRLAPMVPLLILALVGGATSASGSAPVQPISAAVAKTSATALGGSRRAMVHRARPIIVRFVPQARFAIGIVLKNKAQETVTLERVRVVRPKFLPLLQVGTRITRHAFPACHGDPACLVPIAALVSPPFRAVRTEPRPLAPGHNRVVQLNFRFGACAAQNAKIAPMTRLLVTYRTRAGLVVHQQLPLGDSTTKVIDISKKDRCHLRD